MSNSEGLLVDAWRCGPGHSLWLVEQSGQVFVLPVIHNGEIRRAKPGDAFIAGVPQGTSGRFCSTIALEAPVRHEVKVEVDQTNESLVVDDAWILKWNMAIGSSRSLAKSRRLGQSDFAHTPRSFGHLTWTSDEGREYLLASVHQYLPDSDDGWTWCVAKAMANDVTDWPRALGEVVGGMHDAFDGTDLAHGDLHVGQILRHADSYYVIDFDGDPLGDAPESWLSDVVSMLCSFIHVAAVAQIKYGAAHDVAQWVTAASDDFLESYFEHRPGCALPPRRTLWGLMAAKEESEREYAQKFLPEWTYAAEYGRDFVERMIREGE